MPSINWLIVATFGVSGATATAITGIIVKLVNGSLTWGRALALIAATGVGAIVIGGLTAIGLAWLTKKLLKDGESGLTAW